jgi:hypothetical protein
MAYTFDENIVSDLHKDAYGFRPGQSFWNYWTTCSDDEKQAEWDNLLDALDRAVESERADRARAEHDFQCTIASLMHAGAQDFEMAIRWLHDANDTQGDDEYLEYRLGIGYGYIREARESMRVANELLGQAA